MHRFARSARDRHLKGPIPARVIRLSIIAEANSVSVAQKAECVDEKKKKLRKDSCHCQVKKGRHFGSAARETGETEERRLITQKQGKIRFRYVVPPGENPSGIPTNKAH